MSTESFTPIPLDSFGGLYTYPGSGLKVPVGRSPSCANVQFAPGRVWTRPGVASVTFSGATGNILSIKEFVLLDPTQRRTLVLTSSGSLYVETGNFVYSTIASDLVETSLRTDLSLGSTTLFGKEYLAFGYKTKGGYALPRQYDDTNLDPVAPSPPAEAPTLANSGPPSGTPISVGVHKARVFFKTRTGYWTALGPEGSWTADGLRNVDVGAIPVGPSYVTARVIAFTPSCSDDFYFIEGSNMVINDNATASVVNGIGFSDAELIAGTPVSSQTNPDLDLMRQVELPAQAGVASYHGRLCWWGGRNTILRNGDTGPLNLNFNGGWSTNRPLGWTEKVSGQTKQTGSAGAVGDTLRITGDGTNQKGCLENTPNVSKYLPPGVSIWGRVRAKINSGTTGTLNVYIVDQGNIASYIAGWQINVGTQFSASEWRIVEGEVLTAGANIPTNGYRLRITTGGTGGTVLNNGGWVEIDHIELYPKAAPFTPSLLRWSKTGDPESYDGLTGIMSVGEDDGQRITDCFVLRDNFYIVKDRSIYVTRDNGATEPNAWAVENVSSTIGTPSVHGTSPGEGWVAVAARSGLHLFAGGLPQNIMKDIMPTWDRINWAYGHTIWVVADVERDRILVGAPIDGATSPNAIIDFEWFGGDPGAPTKWEYTLWTNAHTCAAFSERSDGTRVLLLGDLQGRLGKLDNDTHADFGTGINSFYRTAFLNLDRHRDLIGYLTMNVNGSGTLSVNTIGPDQATMTAWGSLTLQNPPNLDHEWTVRAVGEQLALQVGTTAAGDWFSLERITPWIREKAGAPVRGRRS